MVVDDDDGSKVDIDDGDDDDGDAVYEENGDYNADLVAKSVDEKGPWTLGGSPQSLHCPPDNLRRRPGTRRPVQSLR